MCTKHRLPCTAVGYKSLRGLCIFRGDSLLLAGVGEERKGVAEKGDVYLIRSIFRPVTFVY